MDVSSIVLAVLAGAVYGGLFYFKAQQNSGEEFDYGKFGATILLAAIIGLAMGAMGMPVTQATLEVQLVAYVGYVVVLETVLKLIWGKLYPPEVPS